MIYKIITFLLLTLSISATEYTSKEKVPFWVRSGILMTESSSFYNEDGTIKYINKARSNARAIGCFQMQEVAFKDVAKKGESFLTLEINTAFAEELSCRYLLMIYNKRGKQDWNRTIMLYNCGPYREPTNEAKEYLKRVIKYSIKK